MSNIYSDLMELMVAIGIKDVRRTVILLGEIGKEAIAINQALQCTIESAKTLLNESTEYKSNGELN